MNGATSAKCTPAAPRGTSVRKLMALLAVPGQVGYPPTMDSGAPLGSSCMGYQSPDVAFGSRGAAGCLSFGLVGATPRAHSLSKQNLAHRARVGYCPNCTRATRVGLPATYALGEYSTLEAEGVAP